MRHFTLHVRLTKRCNADCSYCSSWQEAARSHMPLDELHRALDFITARVLPLMGFDGKQPAHAAVQFLGGELLIVPRAALDGAVAAVRSALEPFFTDITLGGQSNLIGAAERVLHLHSLFGGNLGTSIDTYGRQRRLAGDPAAYRGRFDASLDALKTRRRHVPGAIFVVDREGLVHAEAEFDRALAEGRPLTFRTVFRGGRAVDDAAPDAVRALYGRLFDRWFLTADVPVEPFFHLASARAAERGLHVPGARLGCPFQADCAEVSLDLEPDGTLYVCQDMADSGQFPLGNAVEGTFDNDVWEALAARKQHLDAECRVCPYRRSCQGGCMSEALHHTGTLFGRTAFCGVWKDLFARIDRALAATDPTAAQAWFAALAHGGRAHG